MSWRNGQTLGDSLLQELVTVLKLNEHWMEEQPDGFTWWAGDYRQKVWCEPGVFHQTETVYRIHCETDVIRGRGKAAQWEVALEREMDHTSLNAMVYSTSEDTYKLHSSIFATEANVGYLKRTAFAAVILQVIEAEQVARKLQTSVGAVPATSSHPVSGLRTTRDAMLSAEETFFCPAGKGPSRWTGVSEWMETERVMERESEKFHSDHQTHLQAEFPWHASQAPRGIVLDVTSRELHPILGSGLHFTLTIPLMMSQERVSHMAIELNQYERDESKRSHMLGSWSCHDGLIAYRSFIPNTVYRPDLLPQLTLNMAVRAHWVDDFFVQKRRQAEASKAST